MVDYLKTGAIRQAVNFSPLDPETLRSLRDYLNVSHRLGLLCGQMLPAPPQSCIMRFKGNVCERDTKLLTSAFAAGLMTKAMDQDISIVSAAALMKERGIKVVEERSADAGGFNSLVCAEIKTAKGTLSVAGTRFGSEMSRLVQMNDCRLEGCLEGNMLVFRHKDRPGVIGAVGSLFGKYDVNIAQMSVGGTGESIGILSLDSCPPAEAITELLKLPDIIQAWNVQMPAADESPSWLG